MSRFYENVKEKHKKMLEIAKSQQKLVFELSTKGEILAIYDPKKETYIPKNKWKKYVNFKIYDKRFVKKKINK